MALHSQAEAFETVRRVADEDVRALTAAVPDCASVRAAQDALDAATTAEDVIALEHLVVAAWSELRLTMVDDRVVRIGDHRRTAREYCSGRCNRICRAL